MENTASSAGHHAPPREYPIIDAIAMKLKDLLHSCEPSPEVSQHFRNSRIEFLKGIRQIIDNRIQHMNRASDHGQRVTVE
jgi:hypothetical protein